MVLGFGFFGRGRRVVGKSDFTSHPVLALSLYGCLLMTGFWCLTSRACFQYLLPVSPLVAMWSAMKFSEWGVLERAWLGKMVKVVAVFTGAGVIIGLSIAWWAGHASTGKIPNHMYREVQRLQRETPAYADAKFYFARNAPYSAEFYLRDAVRVHPRETMEESLANSGRDFLLMRARDVVKLETSPARGVLLEKSKWTVFAPSEGDPQ
jgi:hypothetical protein